MLRISRVFVPILSLSAGAALLAAEPPIPDPARPAGVGIIKDVAYKEGAGLSDYERERCKLDLYLPQDRRGFPVLVWFHGGALTQGDKAEQVELGSRLASDGVAVAMPNYRLSPRVRYPEYNRDAAEAVAWVLRHIAEHGGRPDLVFVGGHSAGGYLTMIVGADEGYLKAYGTSPDRLAGLIPVSGQMATHSTVRAERGDESIGLLVDSAAPLNRVRKGLPPVLDICAEGDDWRRLEENRLLQMLIEKESAGVSELHVIPGRDHMTVITQVPRRDDPVAQKILEFIAKISAQRK
jgi:acetyl esterase/lipase